MKEITPLLEQLAEKMGVVTDVLWVALLKQAAVHGTIYAAMGVALVALCVLFVWRGRDAWEDLDDTGVFYYCTAGLLLFVVIAYLTELPRTLAALFNPEYWALTEILKHLKG